MYYFYVTDIRWSSQETQLLVAIRIEQDTLFKLNRTHRSLWDGISKKMAEKGIKYTGVQRANKWKSLKRDYTAVNVCKL
jgi:hypothetical protein